MNLSRRQFVSLAAGAVASGQEGPDPVAPWKNVQSRPVSNVPNRSHHPYLLQRFSGNHGRPARALLHVRHSGRAQRRDPHAGSGDGRGDGAGAESGHRRCPSRGVPTMGFERSPRHLPRHAQWGSSGGRGGRRDAEGAGPREGTHGFLQHAAERLDPDLRRSLSAREIHRRRDPERGHWRDQNAGHRAGR